MYYLKLMISISRKQWYLQSPLYSHEYQYQLYLSFHIQELPTIGFPPFFSPNLPKLVNLSQYIGIHTDNISQLAFCFAYIRLHSSNATPLQQQPPGLPTD